MKSKTRYDPNLGLIVLAAEVRGPVGSAILRLALDTGATVTLINAARLVALGYGPGASERRVRVTTGSGVEYIPRISIRSLACLGARRSRFSVIAHTLPPSATVDGLLGLDFLRNHRLSIDFRKHEIHFMKA